ncbi:MAG: hypothetical protein ACXAEX_15175 [Promethearchaeota archaeon]
MKEFRKLELIEFLSNFQFISIKKGNYIYYIVINKILFIIECISFLKYDISNVSKILDFNGFEKLIKELLAKNNYHTVVNFRFSEISKNESQTSQKRYEIDVIGIYLNYVLLIDAKQWKRKDSYGALNKAANLQYNRTKALKRNLDVFSHLVLQFLGDSSNLKKYLPFTLVPIMVTLEDNSSKLNENQVPLVSIYEFNAFLQELPNNLQYFKSVQIAKVITKEKKI